jgi:hypothetical protein
MLLLVVVLLGTAAHVALAASCSSFVVIPTANFDAVCNFVAGGSWTSTHGGFSFASSGLTLTVDATGTRHVRFNDVKKAFGLNISPSAMPSVTIEALIKINQPLIPGNPLSLFVSTDNGNGRPGWPCWRSSCERNVYSGGIRGAERG